MLDLRFLLLLVCFFLSGFAALLYQTAWTREFAFLFGTSELAVVAVLAAYMAGLAGGAAIAARVVGRLTRPVLAYGLLELGIAVFALLVPTMIRLVQGLYITIAGGLDAPPETMALSTALFHLFGSFLVLFPCTALMGATLPLLARYAVSDDAQVGPRIGVLYAVNTFGAIAGTLVAAFFLLPAIGLRQTVFVGIGGNALVFLAAAALARGIGEVEPDTGRDEPRGARFHWILPAMTLSGVVSFVYEVLWTRMLGHVLGGSTAAFASMLSSFLLGIALGSALASRFATTREAATRGFAIAQLGCGVLGYLAFRSVDLLPDLALKVGANPAAPAAGAAVAGLVLLPVTLCIGATFPFGVRLLARDADEAAAISGRVYAWNTVGSIIGAVLAGFFLLPTLGLERTALVGVLTSLALAVTAGLLATPRHTAIAGAAAVALLAALVVGVPQPSGLLMHSAMSGTRMGGELWHLAVGRSATVTVVENDRGWRLLTNGLPESGVDRAALPDGRFKETAWLSLLPTAARPDTKDMLLIGLGGAQTLEAVASSVESIDVIELEEEVVVANKLMPRPTDPFADPRVSLRLGDARGAMHLSDKKYDAIVSQPSHPWTSGASHLYTREFFELVESQLNPGGTFIQWIGVGFVTESLVGNLAAAMTDVFDHVQLYRPVPAALVFIASNEPLDIERTGREAIAATPGDFGRYGIHRVEDLMASRALDQEGVRGMAEGHPPNTDDHNRLATTRIAESERRDVTLAVEKKLQEFEPWTSDSLEDLSAVAVLRRMRWLGQGERAIAISRNLDPGDAFATRGWLAADVARLKRARTAFGRAIAVDPDNEAARFGLIVTWAKAKIDELGEDFDWTPRQRALMKAMEHRLANEWDEVAALDDELAEFAPADFGAGLAHRLRALWRIEQSADTRRGAEAVEILDRILTRQRSSEHYYQRMRAAANAGDAEKVWAGLYHFLSARRVSRAHPPKQLQQLIRQVGGEPPAEWAMVPGLLEQVTQPKPGTGGRRR